MKPKKATVRKIAKCADAEDLAALVKKYKGDVEDCSGVIVMVWFGLETVHPLPMHRDCLKAVIPSTAAVTVP